MKTADLQIGMYTSKQFVVKLLENYPFPYRLRAELANQLEHNKQYSLA